MSDKRDIGREVLEGVREIKDFKKVVGEEDVVILKLITAPSLESFDALIQKARQHANASGLNRTDITNSIAKARKKTQRSSSTP